MWRPALPIFWFGLGISCGWVACYWYPKLRQWFVRIAGVVLLLLFTTDCFAQHVHRDGTVISDEVGKFYSTWRQPTLRSLQGNRVRSCCDRNDCEPAEIVVKDNKLYVRNHKMRPGEDVEIPPSVIEQNQSDPRESPDGLNHACVNSSGVLCATLGAGG